MVTSPTRDAEIFARFPGEASSAAAARHMVSQALFDWGCQGLEEVARLLVSELVGNALLHTGGGFDMRAQVSGGVLHVEVHDQSTLLPDRKYYSRMSGTGRGLMLVETLSTDWGAYPRDGGKVVWFDLHTGR